MKTAQKLIPVVLLTVVVYTISHVDAIPWWSFTVACFLFGLYRVKLKNTLPAFQTCFLVLFIVWLLKAFLTDLGNEGDIYNQVSASLKLQSKYLLIILSAAMAGILGGLAEYTGIRIVKDIFN